MLYLNTSVLVTPAVSGFCSISLSVFGFGKDKIWFSDLLFDAVRRFSGFSSESMRLNDLNRKLCFRFSVLIETYFGLLLLFVRFCGFLYSRMPLL